MFRAPYYDFFSTCDDIKSYELFDRWSNTDAVGKKASEIRLLLLETLKNLGRERASDNARESTCISGDAHRVFF